MLAEFLYKSAGDELFLEHLEGDLGCLKWRDGKRRNAGCDATSECDGLPRDSGGEEDMRRSFEVG
jgi:hypothetical protein